MTFRTMRRTLLVAFGVGALTSAGQLGLGYGLGILRFGRAFDDADVNHWPAQLAWLAWFAMTAAMIGAAVAGRTADRSDIGVRVATAVAAALGGTAVAPLSMVPAQTAQVTSVDPVLVAGISAVLGAAVGLFAALAVLGPRPIRWNLAAIVGAGWLLALASVIPSLGPTDPMPAVRLGVFDPAWLSAGLGQRLAIITMPALTLVAGAVTGGVARWRGYRLPVVAACGVAGAATLSLAYLIAGPGSSADRYQTAPYWGALAAAATGVLGSVLAATIRWPILADAAPAEKTDAAVTAPDVDTDSGRAEGSAAGVSVGSAAEATVDLSCPGAGLSQAGTSAPEKATHGSEKPSGGSSDTIRRPTTDDFWPPEPSPARPAETTEAETTATGTTEAGTVKAEAAGVKAAEIGTELPAVRSGRSWRRLLRRSDPGGPAGESEAADAKAANAEAHVGKADSREADAGGTDVGKAADADADTGTKVNSARNMAAAGKPAAGKPADRKPADRKRSKNESPKNESTDDKPAGGKGANDKDVDSDPAGQVPRQRERRERRGRDRTEPEVPAADAEYVDWVSGLRGRRPARDQPRPSGSTPPLPSPGGRPSE